LAGFAAVSPGDVSVLVLKTHYASAFTNISGVLVAALLICLILNRYIKRIIAGEIEANYIPVEVS